MRKPPAPAIPRFLIEDAAFVPGREVTLGEEAAHHMRVRRVGPGMRVALLDGAGQVATGTLRALAKRNAAVEVDAVAPVPSLSAVHLLVPVADRERMLWLAEKVAELGLTSWRPVLWRRSRSVSPRGEGSGFGTKVRARMAAALEQSGHGWLPTLYPEATPERALAALPATGARVLLDPGGDATFGTAADGVTIALGPEGGLEPDEGALLRAAGFAPVALGPTTLRFETAGVVAVGLARAAALRATEHAHAGTARQ
jgi:16S rRNA (uracil1498-N3)-methyltransferase